MAAAVATRETATDPTHRVALAHPLISRALRDRERDTKRSSSSSNRHGCGGVQEQLRQLQAERTAHLEMLEMMTQQAQALLREKQQLHASAAALEAQNAQLEERLDYFLGGREEQVCSRMLSGCTQALTWQLAHHAMPLTQNSPCY